MEIETLRVQNTQRLLEAEASGIEAKAAALKKYNDAATFLELAKMHIAAERDVRSDQAKAMGNPTTTVTQGTLIPAILETAIDTNVPGYVRAVVSQDVRSFDGTKVLVPRSSRLIGQYQSGLQNGQKSAYVIWTRLIRPDGASVNLASPAIGFDGTTGLAGKVSGDGFFRRFGSALLLSVVGGVGSLATGGAAGVLIGGASSSAAATAAQQDGQRGPTVRVRQGEPLRIFTARDLDFSSVS